MRKQKRVAFGLTATLLLMAVSPHCVAAIYKCTGQDGKITYGDTPCTPDEKSQQMATAPLPHTVPVPVTTPIVPARKATTPAPAAPASPAMASGALQPVSEAMRCALSQYSQWIRTQTKAPDPDVKARKLQEIDDRCGSSLHLAQIQSPYEAATAPPAVHSTSGTTSLAASAPNWVYDLKLLVNDQPVDFHVPWRCKPGLQGPNFGPGALIQHVMKPTISISWIVRRISGGAAIFSPLRTNCYGDGAPEVDPPSIYVVDNPANPTSLQIFTRKQQVGLGYTVRVVTSSIAQPSKAEPDYSDTRAERDLLDTVRNSCTGYQKVVAYTFPESGWGSSQGSRNQFGGLTTLSLGPFRNMESFNSRPMFPISLVRQGDRWRLPSLIPSENLAEVFFPLAGPRQTTETLRGDDLQRPAPPVTVEIDATQIPLGTGTIYVYEPKNRWVMKLINQKFNCWSLR